MIFFLMVSPYLKSVITSLLNAFLLYSYCATIIKLSYFIVGLIKINICALSAEKHFRFDRVHTRCVHTV